MATCYVQFDDSLVKSVTFSGIGKKDHTSGSFTFTSPLTFTGVEVYGTWSGKIYWDPTSSHSDPTLVANVSNGVVSMSSAYTVAVKDRTIYIYGEKNSSSSVLQVGSWPSVLYSVTVTNGTFTQSNNAISYSSQQRISTISLTGSAVSNNWTGTIYWGTSSGSTMYPIADVDSGSVTMRSSIEPIDYTGTRTIYFTAIGGYYHKVKYFANGGTWSSGSDPYVDLVSDGSSSGTSTPSNKLSRNGYRLLGWSTSSTATSATYGTNDVIGPLSADLSIWAVWIKNTVTITLDANGGVFTDTRSSLRSITNQVIGSQFVFTSYSKIVSRDNYELIGWSADKNATSATYPADGGYVTVGGTDATYYAVWQKSVVTITLYANGGTFGGTMPYLQLTKKAGDILYFSEYSSTSSPPLLRAYYTLVGWSTSSSGSAAWDTNGYVSIGATDADYYAVWKPHIDPFYWDGGTGSTDASIIARGLPVTNLTAARWNLLKAKVKEISTAKGVTYTYTEVAPNDPITSTEYNGVRNAIYNVPGHGTLPPAKARNTEILASLFNGDTSLKSALNAAIISYNNS